MDKYAELDAELTLAVWEEFGLFDEDRDEQFKQDNTQGE